MANEVDYHETVDLHGLPPDTPTPRNAEVLRFGRLKTIKLADAVREVVEEWTLIRQASAMVFRSGSRAGRQSSFRLAMPNARFR